MQYLLQSVDILWWNYRFAINFTKPNNSRIHTSRWKLISGNESRMHRVTKSRCTPIISLTYIILSSRVPYAFVSIVVKVICNCCEISNVMMNYTCFMLLNVTIIKNMSKQFFKPYQLGLSLWFYFNNIDHGFVKSKLLYLSFK